MPDSVSNVASGALAAGVQRQARRHASFAVAGHVWGLLDQGLVSATNLVTTVLLARGMSPVLFGTFTLVYSILLFFNSVQSSLISQPHNVLGAVRSGPDYRRYTGTTAIGQLGMTLTFSALLALAALASRVFGWRHAHLLLALAVAVFAWQLQEFVRRVLYTEQRVSAAFLDDVLSYGGQSVLIAVLWFADALTPARALWAIAATSALGALPGAWQLRHSVALSLDRGALLGNWVFGKWIAGGELLAWLSSVEMAQYISAAVLGPAAAGALRSTQVIFGPTRLLAFSLNNILPAQFARLLRENRNGLDGELRQLYGLTGLPLAVYCLAAILFARPLLTLLYGDRYLANVNLVPLLAVYAGLSYVMLILSAALRARRDTSSVFRGYACSGLFTALFGWGLIQAFGIEGIAISISASCAIAIIIFRRAYARGAAGTDPTGNIA